jgi:hypothetical protein
MGLELRPHLCRDVGREENAMNGFFWFLIVVAAIWASRSLGGAVLANVLVVVSIAMFVLLFVAGWIAQQYSSR